MSDVILPLPPVPPGIAEAALRGILIPFIGAGVSRLAGCPDWPTFADGALRSLVAQRKLKPSQIDQIKHLSPRIKLSLARAFEDEHEVSINYRDILHPPNNLSDKKGCRLYHALSKLATIFVTTNYDEWLDKTLQEPAPSLTLTEEPADTMRGSRPNIIYRPQDFLPDVLSRENTVVHLHGCLNEPKDMILTTRDYLHHYSSGTSQKDPSHENCLLRFLEHLFNHKCVLFIGYGLEELEILEYILLKRKQASDQPSLDARHYLIQGFFSHEEALFFHLQRYY